jgi:hypothetical protein
MMCIGTVCSSFGKTSEDRPWRAIPRHGISRATASQPQTYCSFKLGFCSHSPTAHSNAAGESRQTTRSVHRINVDTHSSAHRGASTSREARRGSPFASASSMQQTHRGAPRIPKASRDIFTAFRSSLGPVERSLRRGDLAARCRHDLRAGDRDGSGRPEHARWRLAEMAPAAASATTNSTTAARPVF